MNGDAPDPRKHGAASRSDSSVIRTTNQPVPPGDWPTHGGDDLLSNISHEFRTPLYGVVGMIELALQDSVSPAVRDYLQSARDSAELLERIVSDLIDFSRLVSNKLSLEPAPFQLRATLSGVVADASLAAGAKGMQALADFADNVPDYLIGDEGRLRQVVVNLLDNAIKFSVRGDVILRVRAQPSGDAAAQISFEIIDHGIGIRKTDYRHIFEPYWQADSSTTREHGGTGLGLTLAARLAALMNGDIAVESRRGLGSTFRFRVVLPLDTDSARLAADAAATDAATVPQLHSPARILLADDTPTSQKIVKSALAQRGHEVQIAHNGREAVEMMRSQSFDLVLMDVRMPRMDGLEATSLIRRWERGTGRHVPIVAMTAHTMQGDRERCLAAGMDDYLPKPVTMTKLIDTVETLSRARGSVSCYSGQWGGTTMTGAANSPQVCDMQAALSRLGQSAQLLDDLIGFFLEDYPGLVTDLREGLARHDARAAARAAHSLKGLSSSFDAHAVVQVAAAAERAADIGDLATAGASVAPLEHELNRLRDALYAYRQESG